MKNAFFLIFTLLLTACGNNFVGNELKVDARVQPFVTRFLQESSNQGKSTTLGNLTIDLDDSLMLKDGSWTLGVCYSSSTGKNRVAISTDFWLGPKDADGVRHSVYSAAEKEELLFHELGHCVLGRDHVTRTAFAVDRNQTIPVSIMYPYHLGQRKYSGNYDYYMKELFGTSTTEVLYAYGTPKFDDSFYAGIASLFEEEVVTVTGVTAKVNPETLSIEGLGCGEDHQH